MLEAPKGISEYLLEAIFRLYDVICWFSGLYSFFALDLATF